MGMGTGTPITLMGTPITPTGTPITPTSTPITLMGTPAIPGRSAIRSDTVSHSRAALGAARCSSSMRSAVSPGT
jgi:hypothetical protein